jgi:glycosyltransferase involved in cell wall biosynthesis
MRILLWHVHGSWTTSFVQGHHTYLLPVLPDRGPDGRGRARTWEWPPNAQELAPRELADTDVDVLVVQRERDLVLAEQWLAGRRPGTDLPIVWLEHNAPQGRINEMRHPAADRPDVSVVVHVTPTNDLFWDTGATPTAVIPHGIPDPGAQWTGTSEHAAVVVNEPYRRARVVGADLLHRLAEAAPIDVFGLGDRALERRPSPWPERLHACGELGQADLHAAMAERRCYLHPFRWTSLGLSLVEAMHLGMPVVALATTDVPDSVPPGCGIVSNDLDVLRAGLRQLRKDAQHAAALGAAARAHALERFGLARFLADWNALLEDLR